jgi:hypothetical protein
MMQVDRGKYSRDPDQAYMDNPHYIGTFGYGQYVKTPLNTCLHTVGFGATISAPHMV